MLHCNGWPLASLLTPAAACSVACSVAPWCSLERPHQALTVGVPAAWPVGSLVQGRGLGHICLREDVLFQKKLSDTFLWKHFLSRERELNQIYPVGQVFTSGTLRSEYTGWDVG